MGLVLMSILLLIRIIKSMTDLLLSSWVCRSSFRKESELISPYVRYLMYGIPLREEVPYVKVSTYGDESVPLGVYGFTQSIPKPETT